MAHHGSNQWDSERFTKKLLVLGSGSAGKTTLFRKLRTIHFGSLDASELEGIRPTIRQNVVFSIIILMQQSQLLYEKNNEEFKDCYVELTNELNKRLEVIMAYANDDFDNESTLDFESLKYLSEAIEYLWDLKNIRNLYRRRGNLFSMPDNMEFFLNKVKSVMKKDFLPNEQDFLKTRARTIGMTDYEYESGKNRFHIFDVGGQRSERRKWIHHFNIAHAVVYVAALNHYNTVLFEDNSKNAMLESVELFEEIVNSKWFRLSEIVLLLNKDDLFVHKLRNDKIPLSVCFSKEGKWPEESEYWTDGHYNDNANLSQSQNDEKFMEFHDRAIDFIGNVYENRNRIHKSKQIHKHVIIATQTSDIERVFGDIQSIVIKSNLIQSLGSPKAIYNTAETEETETKTFEDSVNTNNNNNNTNKNGAKSVANKTSIASDTDEKENKTNDLLINGLWRLNSEDLISKGSFGVIYRCTNIHTNTSVAAKLGFKDSKAALEKEIDILRQLKRINSQNVIKLFHFNTQDAIHVDGAKYDTVLVGEYVPNGKLIDILNYCGALEEDIARTYFAQIISALKAFHGLNIIHRDLNPQNILLDEKFNIKISGFGLTRIAETVGVTAYKAPEILEGAKYSGAVDIFSTGVILFSLLTARVPFEKASKQDEKYKLLMDQNTCQQFWDLESKSGNKQMINDKVVQSLIEQTLKYDAKDRITIEVIEKHEWYLSDKYLSSEQLVKVMKPKYEQSLTNKQKSESK